MRDAELLAERLRSHWHVFPSWSLSLWTAMMFTTSVFEQTLEYGTSRCMPGTTKKYIDIYVAKLGPLT